MERGDGGMGWELRREISSVRGFLGGEKGNFLEEGARYMGG